MRTVGNNVMRFTIAGCGALGSRIAVDLARLGSTLALIDSDRVEEHNIGNQVYSLRDIGAMKVSALNRITSLVGASRVTSECIWLSTSTAHILNRLGNIVVDCFDNVESRLLLRDACIKYDLPCLHVGIATGIGEIRWNSPDYKLSATSVDLETCGTPMSLSNIAIISGLALEVLIRYVETGECQDLRFYLPTLEIVRL